MAIVVVSVGSAHMGAPSQNTCSVTVPAGGVPTGALICQNYVNTQGSPGAQTRTYSDSAGNSYAEKIVIANASGGLAAIASTFNCIALVSGNFIKCVLSANTNGCLSVFYATGIKTTSDPYDSACNASNTGTGISISLASGSPSVANTLLVATICTLSTITGFIDPGGWTAIQADSSNGTGTNFAIHGGTQVASASQAYSPSWTGSSRWAAVLTGFAPASSGGGARTIPLHGPFGLIRPPGGLTIPVGAALLEAMKRNPTLARRSFFDLSRWGKEQ
jgi:hypothetical protein